MERIEQSSSHAVPHTFGTIATSGNETEGSEPRKRVRSKRTYKIKRCEGRMSRAASLRLGRRTNPGE